MQNLFSSEPQLSSIAVNAAIEIEKLLNEEPSIGLENLNKLSELLSKNYDLLPNTDNVAQGNTNFIDPVSSELFRRAINESFDQDVTSHEELYTEAKKVIQNFQDFVNDSNLDKSFLKSLRNFCLAISKYSLTIQDQYSNIVSD